MTDEEIYNVISTLQVGQFWRDTRKNDKIPESASREIEIMDLIRIEDFNGHMNLVRIDVSYKRKQRMFGRPTIHPPKIYHYNPRKFAESFVRVSLQDMPIIEESTEHIDRFDRICE